jgi:hypothetical protein
VGGPRNAGGFCNACAPGAAAHCAECFTRRLCHADCSGHADCKLTACAHQYNANTNTHFYGNAHRAGDSDHHPDSAADTDSDEFIHTDFYRNGNAHRDTDTDSHRNTNGNKHTDSHRYPNSDENIDAHRKPIGDSNTHSSGNNTVDANTHSNPDPYADRDTYRDAHSDGDHHPDTDGN